MNEKKFEFTYSALTEEERREVESIKRRYLSPDGKTESGLERLRRLDAKVKKPPSVAALSVGTSGCLTFGLGLSMILEWSRVPGGIAVSLVGGVLMSVAYPLYKLLRKRSMNKYSGEILRLSEELLSSRENSPFTKL